MKTAALAAILTFSAVAVVLFSGDARHRLASLFFADDLTAEAIRAHYRDGAVSILIAPGHDANEYGTEYRGMREADLTARIGSYLAGYLAADPKFRVSLTRDEDAYAPEFAAYFADQKEGINAFARSARQYFDQLVSLQFIRTDPPAVYHNRATADAQTILYGINKWANEQNVDIVLHLHLNDYAGRDWRKSYEGYAIYIPDNELPNHEASRELGERLATAFSRYWAPSNLSGENGGIIEDHQLIATGSNGSLRSAAALIEYGYIYEARFHTDTMLKEAAFRTYQGLRAFFDGDLKTENEFAWTLPYQWKENITEESRLDPDVVALQAALADLDLYPPGGMSARECPINGNFLTCTQAALKAFQKRFGIEQTGLLGPKTREKLNELFSQRVSL